MPMCPEGHTSTSFDYCDVCGAPIPATALPPTAAPMQPQPNVPCPHCKALNSPDALFCEACGYDYTTGTLPRSAKQAASWLDIDTPEMHMSEPPQQPNTPVNPASSSLQAAQPPADADVPADLPAAVPGPGASTSEQDVVAMTPAIAEQQADIPIEAAVPVPSDSSAPDASQTATIQITHVAEIWIDPDWYAIQVSSEKMPSPGLPTIVPLGTSALIGRVSKSRNIYPEIDCEPDTGVSRRQAQLTTDGQRWFVEDLESSNGTYLGHAGAPLPEDPLPSGKHELAEDDRIFVGAWTRIVIRPALPDEVATLAGQS